MAAPMEYKEVKTKVSSVLNRDTKQFGKKHLFDGDDETCWNSDQGSPQWIQIEFPHTVLINAVHIQFQGGFVGRECSIKASESSDQSLSYLLDFYPEDNNKMQTFELQKEETVKVLKIIFINSTDFFGRITIYKIDFT